MQNPRARKSKIDLIWAPEHDRLRGKNVVTTLTSPHHVGADALGSARAHRDPRIVALQIGRAHV